MISDRVLLSAGVDIIVIIFQKGKLNGISVGDRKKKFNAYRPLKIKRKKVEVNKNKRRPAANKTLFQNKDEIRNKTIVFLGLTYMSHCEKTALTTYQRWSGSTTLYFDKFVATFVDEQFTLYTLVTLTT